MYLEVLIMEPKDPTWDDTGFGPEDETFMSASPKPPEPQDPTVEEPSATEQPERRRVEAVGALPSLPEPEREHRKGLTFWLGLVAGIIFLIAISGGGYYFLTKPSIEDQAFMAPAEPEQVTPPAVPESISIDTVVAPADTSVSIQPSSMADKTIEPLFTEAKPSAVRSTRTEENAPPRETPAAKPPKEAPLRQAPALATTNPSSSAKAMWVVQVFSSPSRDDADEWLQSLREKNVKDGYIVEQNLRGQPWFRVRFGQFPTREGAEAAAVNLGFRQPWIARVR